MSPTKWIKYRIASALAVADLSFKMARCCSIARVTQPSVPQYSFSEPGAFPGEYQCNAWTVVAFIAHVIRPCGCTHHQIRRRVAAPALELRVNGIIGESFCTICRASGVRRFSAIKAYV